MRKLILPAFEDPEHSVDVFDADKEICVAPAVFPDLADQYWNDYRDRELSKESQLKSMHS